MIKTLAVFLIVILGFAVYGNSFKNEFIYDDYHLVVENKGIKSFGNLSDIFKHHLTDFSDTKGGKFYRPVTSITFMTDYFFSSLNPLGYHITNTALHILVCILLFVVMYYVTRDTFLSLLVSSLYLVHPIHTQAVTYISGRADSICSIFLLLMVIFQYRYWSSDRKYTKIIYYSSILLSFSLALLSKEIAVIFPFLLMIFEYCVRDKERYAKLTNKKIIFYLPFFMLISIWFFIKNRIVETTPMIKNIPSLKNQLTMVTRMIYNYIRLSIFPADLHMDYRFPPAGSLFRHGYLWTSIFTIALLSLVYYMWKKGRASVNYRIMFFGFSWFLIALFPYMGIAFPLNAIFAEQWLYIPEMGLILSIVYSVFYCLHKIGRAKKYIIFVLVIMIGIYSHLTIKQNKIWRDPFTFYNYMLKHAPYSAVMYNNLAIEYVEKKGNLAMAEKLLQTAVKLDPHYTPAVKNLRKVETNLEKEKGGIQDKKETFTEAEIEENEETVEKAQLLNSLGVKYGRAGDLDKAISLFNQAVKADPDYAESYNNLGFAYYRKGDHERAEEYFRKTLEIDPDHKKARINLDHMQQSK